MSRPQPEKTPAAAQSGQGFAIKAARLTSDRHCTDVAVLDVRTLSPVCDYLLIATGTSERQMRSLGMELVDLGRANGAAPFSSAGLEGGTWVLLDFVDVVVHLFNTETRAFYALEMLWGDAPQVSWTR